MRVAWQPPFSGVQNAEGEAACGIPSAGKVEDVDERAVGILHAPHGGVGFVADDRVSGSAAAEAEAVANNIPGLLQEMMLSDTEQVAAKIPVGWALRANGPILTSHILTFGAKLGLALHFELHKRPVPTSGGVLPIWFSNVQAARGEIPENLLSMLPAARTMRQGNQHVQDQFQYSWVTTDDQHHTLMYAVFRQSFAIAAATADDRTAYLDKWKGRFRVFAPGEARDPDVPGA